MLRYDSQSRQLFGAFRSPLAAQLEPVATIASAAPRTALRAELALPTSQAVLIAPATGTTGPNPCLGVICRPGMWCGANGICVGACSGVICPSGMVCVDGFCKEEAAQAAPPPLPPPPPPFVAPEPNAAVGFSIPTQKGLPMPNYLPRASMEPLITASSPTAVIATVATPEAGIPERWLDRGYAVSPTAVPEAAPVAKEAYSPKPNYRDTLGPKTTVAREDLLPEGDYPAPPPERERPAGGGAGMALAALAGYFLFFK